MKGLQSPWVTLGCAWLLAFSMFSPILCIPPIEHIIKNELQFTHAQGGLLISIPLIVLAVTSIPSGLLADRIGMRKAAGIGAIIIVVGSFLRGASTNLVPLFGFTALLGVGLTLVYPNLPKLISARFPQEKVGLATGIYATGIVIGATLPIAITLPLVFPITNSFQGVFYIWSIPAMVATILWWAIVREPGGHAHVQQVGAGGRSSFWVLKNRNLWLVALMFFVSCFHFYIWAGWTPALMMLKGAPPDLAALIASVNGWVSTPVILLMPWASYKVGVRKPFLWASAIITALASWGAIYVTVPYGWLLMVVLGIPLGGAFPMMLALPIELVPREYVGAASGIVLSVGYIGGLVGPWLAGYILDVTGTLNAALMILAGVAMAWAVTAFVIPETGSRARLQSIPSRLSGQ